MQETFRQIAFVSPIQRIIESSVSDLEWTRNQFDWVAGSDITISRGLSPAIKLKLNAGNVSADCLRQSYKEDQVSNKKTSSQQQWLTHHRSITGHTTQFLALNVTYCDGTSISTLLLTHFVFGCSTIQEIFFYTSVTRFLAR
jgi:hypothetical protein